MHAITTLMDEHQMILRTLASLEALVTRSECADEPVETFGWIVDFLRNYADRLHHLKEENLLFPAMEANGLPAEQGPTAMMRHEHDQGRALVTRMASLTETGADDFDRAAFAEPALEFVGLLRAHIGKEDHILYPMAPRLLRESDLAQLAAAYAKAESEGFEAGDRERYESAALNLAQRLGVDQEHYDASPACH